MRGRERGHTHSRTDAVSPCVFPSLSIVSLHLPIHVFLTHPPHPPQATARVTATLDGRLLRAVAMERVAFELGGAMLCHGQCSRGSAAWSAHEAA